MLNRWRSVAKAVGLTLAGVSLLGCGQPSTDAPAMPMRTSWGEPDLRGTWDFSGPALRRDSANATIVDPPDGRIPRLTRAGLMRLAEMRERMERPPLTPADRPPETRCILGFNSGPPMSSREYNNLVHIVQQPGHVAFLNEMINDHRVVATDGGDHMPERVRFWKGDSRGRWEGDTFVVETRNFREQTTFHGSGPNMRLTERFTRIDQNTLRYHYTVDDQEMFEAPWSVQWDFVRTDQSIFEYACHEGNRGLLLQMRAAKQQHESGDAGNDDSWLPSWFWWVPRRADLLAEQGGETGSPGAEEGEVQ